MVEVICTRCNDRGGYMEWTGMGSEWESCTECANARTQYLAKLQQEQIDLLREQNALLKEKLVRKEEQVQE